MDAKSLLFRMLLKRILKRMVLVGLAGWAVFAWATGVIAPGAGVTRVYSLVVEKVGGKPKDDVAPPDVVASASAVVKVAGIRPGARPTVGPQAKGGYSANDVLCLAHAVYYEARNEPRETQIGVAQVALNRVETMQGQKSICRIVYLGLGRPMGCLFTQTCRNLGTIPDDEARWRAAVELAQEVAAGKTALPEYRRATHFIGSTLRPAWLRTVYKLHANGRFTFYSSSSMAAEEGNEVVDGLAPKDGSRTAALVAEDGLAIRRRAANLPRTASASTVEGTAATAAQQPARPEARKSGGGTRSSSPFGDTFN